MGKGHTGTSLGGYVKGGKSKKKSSWNDAAPASDVKVTKADGTVEWVPSKKKYVKNYGEVKFSGEKE